MERLNASGQAAITDALYFLLVVTGISVLLFSFANTYGNIVSQKVTSNYNTTFSTDALKTILSSSTPRDTTKSLYDPPNEIEVDHLLAYIKEDYSDNGSLAKETKEVLAENIIGILRPILSNFDFAFYISIPTHPTESKFVFIFLKTTDTDPSSPTFKQVAYYFCGEDPANPDTFSDYDNLKQELTKLIVSVGESSSISSRLKLSKVVNQNIESGSNAQGDLAIWAATTLKKENGQLIDFTGSIWNCELYSPVPPI